MEQYDDYGQPDVFSHLANPEHALQSPDALLSSMSQNVFMYEQERNNQHSGNKHEVTVKTEPMSTGNIFEFPNPEEMAELGCSPLMDNCWPETPLLARSLDGSLNDSGVCFSWDLSDDEQEGLFQIEASNFRSAPTLAELNLEDSQSTDNGIGSKRKLDDMTGDVKPVCLVSNVQKTIPGEMSLSPHTWKRVKTEATELQTVDSKKSLGLLKGSSHRPTLHRKHPKSKPSRILASKGARTQSESSKASVKTEKVKPEKLSLTKVHPSKIDFTELFWKHYRRDAIPSPTKDMSRSEFIARTPNPFGNRRFLGRNALLKAKTQHLLPNTTSHIAHIAKSVSRAAAVAVSASKRNSQRARPKRQTSTVHKKPVGRLSVPLPDNSTEDTQWSDLKAFMYEESMQKESSKTTPHRTVITAPDVKSETSKSQRTNSSSDPGFDSHDEGLGSENEDHDDFGSDDDDDDDDDIRDDLSDLSDDPGLPSTSTKRSPRKGLGSRRRRMKTRRSEYDDFTPNPRKLLHIGHELNKLNATISSLCPGNEASMDEKNRTRREKNKLASRACRLKKKAQHEANKVKLWGLGEEAKRLKTVLRSMRKEMVSRVERPKASWDYSLGAKLDHLIKNSLGHMVAGHTSEFVNSVLEKTAKGIPILNSGLAAAS